MRLRDLFSDDVVMDGAVGDLSVTGVAMDSRAFRAGEVFFALADLVMGSLPAPEDAQ
jgi:UDP-N-acetylmuramoyl-L-alanyl-D-glutamate--2,6-diaminopimelate ligase